MVRTPLALVVFVSLLAGSAVAGAEEIRFARGDVDGDGRHDAADLVLFIDWLSGARPVPVIEALDANRDGAVSLADVLTILTFVQTGVEPRPESVKILRGDLDGDGRLTKIDLRHLDRFLRTRAPFPAALDAADLDADGRIDSVDLEKLRDVLRGSAGPNP